MSRNYAHTRVSRVKVNHRKSSKGSNFKLYLFIAIVCDILIFLARDIYPNRTLIEKDVTNQIKAGDFLK
ncbi:MAG: hypothetical protein LW825_00680 [Candidatus Jidaibacter sp.]|nr:hypothetical protein [Candidatus Jidaibacter sp.]